MSIGGATLSRSTIDDAFKCVPQLIERAKARQRITYGELTKRIGAKHHRPAKYWLGFIRDKMCIPNDLPMITAIVVSQSGVPGRSFLPGGTDLDEKSPAYAAKAQEIQEQVFAYGNWERLQAISNRMCKQYTGARAKRSDAVAPHKK